MSDIHVAVWLAVVALAFGVGYAAGTTRALDRRDARCRFLNGGRGCHVERG